MRTAEWKDEKQRDAVVRCRASASARGKQPASPSQAAGECANRSGGVGSTGARALSGSAARGARTTLWLRRRRNRKAKAPHLHRAPAASAAANLPLRTSSPADPGMHERPSAGGALLACNASAASLRGSVPDTVHAAPAFQALARVFQGANCSELRKAHVLYLARVWRYKSDLWCVKKWRNNQAAGSFR